MSELLHEHGLSKLFSLLLLIFSMSLAVILIIVPSASFQREVESEVKSLALLVDLPQWMEVTNKVTMRYSEHYIQSGIQDGVSDALLPKSSYKIKEIVAKYKGDFILSRVVNNLHILAYQMTYRITILGFWVFLLLPYFIAVIHDGYIERRIKMYEPKQISIKGSRIWTRSIVYIVILVFSYLVIPNFMGVTVAAWFPLIMLMATGYAIKKTISNYMKVA